MKLISSLNDYISAVNEINEEWYGFSATIHPWYRGQCNAQWNLIPKIYRSSIENFERELIRDFKLKSAPFLDIMPNDDFEWLFVMQHYGIPTRLLDWTESYLVALYFAVLDFKIAHHCCVWMIDPWSLNIRSINQRSIPISNHPELAKYILNDDPKYFSRELPDEANFPVAIRPRRTTKRIIAQKGTFTIQGKIEAGVNAIFKKLPDVRIAKIIINGSKKRNILKELFLAGISHSVIFPDLEGICNEISFRYSNDYIEWVPDKF